jgi:hypothetical protein
MLKNSIVNVNTRTCPTTFVLLPIPKQNHDSAKRDLFHHASRLYKAVSSPKETVLGMLQEKYYLALICEVCRLHSDDHDLWYLIEKPKEIVGKILPLARAGLKFAFVLNKASALGRLFGLPTPVLEDSTIAGGRDFLDDLENGTLANYSELERLAEENYQQGGGGGSGAVSGGETGYCIREFSAFLAKKDPEKRWANLSARVNEKGDLCYICPACLAGASST